MMLDVHSDAWKQIYEGIAADYFARNKQVSRGDMEAHLLSLGIMVHKTSEGRWEWIDVLNHEYIMELYLKSSD